MIGFEERRGENAKWDEDRGKVEMYIDWAEYDQKDRGRSKGEMKGNRKREMGMEGGELL